MSDAEWAAALKQAAAIDDYDARYGLCERFLNRALLRVYAHNEVYDALVSLWFARNRRDDHCADMANRLLSHQRVEMSEYPVIEVVAGLCAKDAPISPEGVGAACAIVAYNVAREDMHKAQVSTQRPGIPMNTKIMARVASIALDNEQRLQMLDVQEELALLARARGG